MSGQGEEPAGFILAVSIWLWFTVVFANFAEAVAEGRGKAQAESLRAHAPRRDREAARGSPRRTPRTRTSRRRRCARATSCSSKPATSSPATEPSSKGVASVDESAITGESAPVIRESGDQRSAVTGGTRVLSDWLVVEITANPGETFLDRMISLVEGAKRKKTPNEIALAILLAGLTIIFLLATATLQPFSAVRRRDRRPRDGRDHHRALRAARVPDPDDHRRTAVRDRHRRHGPDDPGQRDRDVGPRRRGRGRRRHAAPRQDRDDHARQPPGHGVHSGRRPERPGRSPTPRSFPRSRTRRPRAGASSCSPRRSTACASGRSARSRPRSCRSRRRRA